MLNRRNVVRIGFLLMVGLMVSGGSSAYAQGNTERRELFENLLKSLVESRMEGTQQSQRYRNPQPQQERRPSQDQDVQRLVRNFSNEAIVLFDIISNESRRDPTLRTFINPILEVQASATVLEHLINRDSPWSVLREEFSSLDQDWRLLSHRMGSSRGLTRPIEESMERLNEYDRQLSEIFDVTPQVDQRAFLRLTDALEGDMQNLLDDIAIELGRSQEARQLLVQGRLIEQQVRFMADAIERQQSREKAVAEFAKFHELWGPFSDQLWQMNNRYLERSLQRIEQADQRLHDVLWLDDPVDNRRLTRLADMLSSDIDKLMETTTLRQLMALNDRDQLLRAASDLHDAKKTLADSVEKKHQLKELQSDFRQVEKAWDELEKAYRDSDEPDVLRLVKTTEQTIASLQEALQLDSVFDRNVAMQILASLENYGEHLQEGFSTKVLPNSQYNRRFSIQGLHTSQQFTAFARNLHYDLAEGVDPEELRARTDTLVRGWKYLNEQYIQKLNGREREDLNSLGIQITPLIVELQTMFEV